MTRELLRAVTIHEKRWCFCFYMVCLIQEFFTHVEMSLVLGEVSKFQLMYITQGCSSELGSC